MLIKVMLIEVMLIEVRAQRPTRGDFLMKDKTVRVGKSLEARSAALFVQNAGKYSSDIRIRLDNKEANAKSIMGIISLGIIEGNMITITANGADEDAAIAEVGNSFV